MVVRYTVLYGGVVKGCRYPASRDRVRVDHVRSPRRSSQLLVEGRAMIMLCCSTHTKFVSAFYFTYSVCCILQSPSMSRTKEGLKRAPNVIVFPPPTLACESISGTREKGNSAYVIGSALQKSMPAATSLAA